VVSGIEGIPKIKCCAKDKVIIIFSTYEEAEEIYGALCAGACSYISKRNSLQKVVDALVVFVAEGGANMSPMIAKRI